MGGKGLVATAAIIWALAAVGQADVPGSWFQVPSSGSAFRLGDSPFAEPGTANPEPELGTRNQEPGTASSTCIVCHDRLVSASGEDVSIGGSWRASMMANSARDPYWQAAVRREVMDHSEAQAAIEDECSICHMPLATYADRQSGGTGRVFSRLPIGASADPAAAEAAEGVSCIACHRIAADKLGTPASFTGGYVLAVEPAGNPPRMFGPFQVDAGRTTVMHSASGYVPAEASHVQTSELCATCHTLFTTPIGGHSGKQEPRVFRPGEVEPRVFTPGETNRLPEQVPYLEWQHSAYRESQTCQSCHMPIVAEPVAVSGVLGQPRDQVSRHVFLGGNFFMMRMLNRYRDELGVVATPGEMAMAIARTVEHLQRDAASVAIEPRPAGAGRLEFDVVVGNLAGHKLPTAYPSRRAWLHVVVRDSAGRTVFESGAIDPSGCIRGNDNDEDAARFEPHHERIERADQVQVYESIMAGANGALTTGLLSGVRYVKDNRLLPAGFDKATAPADVAVHGDASADPDFRAGGDRVTYAITLPGTGPVEISAELRFQPIGYRWAENLRAYDAFETRRFVRYYESMSGESAVTLAVAIRRAP